MAAIKKAERLRAFSPEKLAKLRGDKLVYVMASEVTAKTGVPIHTTAWSKWESGESVPGGDRLAAIAAFFGIPIDDLFE